MRTPIFFVLTAILSLSLAFSSCKDDEKEKTVPVTGVELDETTLTLAVGEEQTLTATVLPANAANKSVTWSSSDPDVATVMGGFVSALAEGTATITATTEDGGKTAECRVSVGPVNVTGVELDKTTISLGEGDEETLTATVLPANATNKAVSWSSSDPAVATVADGRVTALAEGTAIIKVTTEDGDKTAECQVAVSWLGRVTFRTSETWVVGPQTWSDAVMAVRCKKEDYNGGIYYSGEYEVDCLENEGYGDWFSWPAVDKYKDILCPDGWRVPTSDDFINLDKAMGGDGENRGLAGEFMPKYLDDWGGEFGGYCWFFTDGLHKDQVGVYGSYWSQTDIDEKNAGALNFGTGQNFVTPQASGDKANGNAVRCVRD